MAGAHPFASFAPLRLCEKCRLNEEANLSQRRNGAKAQRRRQLILNDHQFVGHLAAPDLCAGFN